MVKQAAGLGCPQLEIAVTGAAGARLAQRAGADRVELCSALELGGMTPSQGLVDAVLEATGGKFGVYTLVRPRPGDFCYDSDELATAVSEVKSLVRQGARGIVLGALTRVGSVAVADTQRLVAAARETNPDVDITFHRAIDHVRDPIKAIAQLVELGIDRVLTSGHSSRAADGLETLAAMVTAADGRLGIMAGGGVNVADIADLVRLAKVTAVHLSAKAAGLAARTGGISLGSATGTDPQAYFVTDPAIVEGAASVVRGLRLAADRHVERDAHPM